MVYFSQIFKSYQQNSRQLSAIGYQQKGFLVNLSSLADC